MLNLYHIQYDDVSFYVEAESFSKAIETWKGHVKTLWNTDYMETDQPESVHLVHDEPVIREAQP